MAAPVKPSTLPTDTRTSSPLRKPPAAAGVGAIPSSISSASGLEVENPKKKVLGLFNGLEQALNRKLITPEEALARGLCKAPYLKSIGYGEVEFEHTNHGEVQTFKGPLRLALRMCYIKIEEAINRGFITREQAIKCGLLVVEKNQN